MSDTKSHTAQYEYSNNPVHFKQLYEEIGKEKLSELLGYIPNTLTQMYKDIRPVRKMIEFACEQYIENQFKKSDKDTIFIFVCKEDSESFKTLNSVAKAVGIEITSL